MKKITFIIALLISTIGFSQNLLQNGDFENIDPENGGQTTGSLPTIGAIWTTSMTASARPGISMNTEVAHAGDHFMNVQNDFQSFRQSFTAEVGKDYTVKLWNQFISGQGQITDAQDGIFISIRDDSGNNGTQFDPIISFYIDPTAYDTGWNEISFTFSAPQTNLLLFVSKQARNADGDGGLNNSCRMDDFSITASSTASVTDLKQFNFNTYPNPASNSLNITASKNIDTIEIYNLLGQKVLDKKINNTNLSLPIAHLETGLYIIKATIEGLTGSYKFVKK
jgi:hypothetical protein